MTLFNHYCLYYIFLCKFIYILWLRTYLSHIDPFRYSVFFSCPCQFLAQTNCFVVWILILCRQLNLISTTLWITPPGCNAIRTYLLELDLTSGLWWTMKTHFGMEIFVLQRAPSVRDDADGHLIYHTSDILQNRCSWIILQYFF